MIDDDDDDDDGDEGSPSAIKEVFAAAFACSD